MPQAFADVAEKMQAGQVSRGIRGPNGFHIIKLLDKRANATQIVTEYHARHILIKVTELVSQRRGAEEDRRSAPAHRRWHEDFAKLAKQNSQDTANAALGGEMGWFPISQYGTKVAETIAKLKNNEISQPFQTDAGWHIMQLLGTRKHDRTEQT